MTMNVNFLDLKKQYLGIKTEIGKAINDVLESTAFSGGPFVEAFEKNFAAAHNAKFCVGVNNGTSALHIALWAMGIERDAEVIVPTNTFFATAEAVSLLGAKPVFVDCESEFYNLDPKLLEKAITSKTKAIIPVHLYGQPAQMDEILSIAKKHGIPVLEDCAQAHLAQYKGKSVGTIGVAGCFSFYPGKNLGAYGEAGAVVTNDETLYWKMRALRDHGALKKYHHDVVGHNYRMEGIQGAVLDVKLKHLQNWTKARKTAAAAYRELLCGIPQITIPTEMKDVSHVFHLYVIRTDKRDELANYLKDNGVHTGIHYPVPCHQQKAYADLGYKTGSFPIAEKYAGTLLSLPMHEGLTTEEIEYVSKKIHNFFA